MTPQRIQRKRTKGWRMPEGAVYVGRPTKWGNPFQPYRAIRAATPKIGRFARMAGGSPPGEGSSGEIHWGRGALTAALSDCVEAFRLHSGAFGLCELTADDLEPLRGRDLCCWCPLDQPCHADVLLELANAPSLAGVGT